MARILIADDENDIAVLISDSLMDEGFETEIVHNGAAVVDMIERGRLYDLIILDIMMPEMEGLSACRKIRDKLDCPILFVTAKSRTLDMLLGLEMGADDYITKPFIVDELVAKVKAHLRREIRRASVSPADTIQLGNLKIQPDNYEVERDGMPVNLTTREFQLLVFMIRNIGKVLTREQIFDGVWGTNYADIGSVNVTIKNLRDKLDPGNRLIKTVWGVGYKLVRPGDGS